MLTIQTISDKVNLAKAYYLEQLAAIYTKMKNGCGDTHKIQPLKRLIRALTFDIEAELVDDTTIINYNCLLKLLQGFSGAYVIDPEVVIPGQTTIVLSQVVGYNINKYPFVTTDGAPTAIFDNYHELYYPLYGNDPVLAMYVTAPDYSGEEQTPPIITFSTPGDSSSNIASIQYNFPIGTAGELQMSGKAPNSDGSGSGGSGGGGSTVLIYSQANLQNAGTVDNPNWYLPLTLPVGKNPVFVTVNGISIITEFDTTFTPNRLWGFSNNDTQVIKVTII